MVLFISSTNAITDAQCEWTLMLQSRLNNMSTKHREVETFRATEVYVHELYIAHFPIIFL